jgi:hypothetical protein
MRNLLRFALGALAVLIVIVMLGMWFPRSVPRVGFLPAPSKRSYCGDGGNSLETWHRQGPIWTREIVGDLMVCDPDPN